MTTENPGDTSYRAQFEQDLHLLGIVIHQKRDVGQLLPQLKAFGYTWKGVRTLTDPLPETISALGAPAEARTMLIDSTVASVDCVNDSNPKDLTKLPTAILNVLEAYLSGKELPCPETDGKKAKRKADVAPTVVGPSELAKRVISLERRVVHLSYVNYTMSELIREVFRSAGLPETSVVPSSFEQVGHIAHLNLTPVQLPFKHKIGQIVLDTNPSVETVVNKTEALSSEFRELPLEVIAGNASKLTAEVRQYGLIFRVPYDKVYWNSRLCEEHERLVRKMVGGDELYDVMAGVGPFVIPAAAKGVVCWGNDLNPASVAAMRENATLNGVTIQTSVLDGRVFIGQIRDTVLRKLPPPVVTSISDGKEKQCRRHFAMNLPALAVKFLDAFRGPLWQQGDVVDRSFVVHVYMFTNAADPKADAVEQVVRNLFANFPCGSEPRHLINTEEAFVVRDVSPKKLMVCVSFSFKPEAFDPEPNSSNTPDEGRVAKKFRTE
jgi:tRNA (guanine37-N1)-methyltransferase